MKTKLTRALVPALLFGPLILTGCQTSGSGSSPSVRDSDLLAMDGFRGGSQRGDEVSFDDVRHLSQQSLEEDASVIREKAALQNGVRVAAVAAPFYVAGKAAEAADKFVERHGGYAGGAYSGSSFDSPPRPASTRSNPAPVSVVSTAYSHRDGGIDVWKVKTSDGKVWNIYQWRESKKWGLDPWGLDMFVDYTSKERCIEALLKKKYPR